MTRSYAEPSFAPSPAPLHGLSSARMSFDKVLKFGGGGLADGPAVLRACEIIQRTNGRPVVVVSAHQGVTDLLDTVAKAALQGILEGDRVRLRHRMLLSQLRLDPELLDRYFTELFGLLAELRVRGRLLEGQRDHLLSFGERMSARIVAQTLRDAGVRATPVDAFDLGLTTDSNFGDARPLPEGTSSIRASLEQVTGVPIVTGFLGKDARGHLTTLGRNGSDLTAALIAEAVGANVLELWKTVPGIMSADPDLEPDAHVIDHLGFREAAECAFHGADVLYGPALEPVERAQILVRIRDVRTPAHHGTLLETTTRGVGPVGIAARRSVWRIDFELSGLDLRGPRYAQLFGALAKAKVEPLAIAASGERLSVHVQPTRELDGLFDDLGRRVSVERDLAVAAVFGKGVGGDEQLFARALELLAEAGVDVVESNLGARSSSQTFVVHAQAIGATVHALHAGLLRPSPVAR